MRRAPPPALESRTEKSHERNVSTGQPNYPKSFLGEGGNNCPRAYHVLPLESAPRADWAYNNKAQQTATTKQRFKMRGKMTANKFVLPKFSKTRQLVKPSWRQCGAVCHTRYAPTRQTLFPKQTHCFDVATNGPPQGPILWTKIKKAHQDC